MAIITPEEWQEIEEKIQYGLEHYGNNIGKLLQTYKSIKSVLIDHGFDPDDKLAYTGILEYPIYISKSFIQLEDRIRELNTTVTKYEGNFSDIAEAINYKGVEVTEDDPYEIYPQKILAIGSGQSVVSGLGAFNQYGYLAGDVIIPEGVTNLSEGVIWNGNLLKTLKFPKSLVSLEQYALARANGNFPIYLTELVFPLNCNFIGYRACRNIGTSSIAPVEITIESIQDKFTFSDECFIDGKVGKIIFSSIKTTGTDIYIKPNALKGSEPLEIQFPINTNLYLWNNIFPQNQKITMNLANVDTITTNSSNTFYKCLLTDNQANQIIKKLTIDSNVIRTFDSCTSLQNIDYNFVKLGQSMFNECSNLSQITFHNNLKIFWLGGINKRTTKINFDNLPEEETLEYYSSAYGSNGINVDYNVFKRRHYTLISSEGVPIMKNLICNRTGDYNEYFYNRWKYEGSMDNQYFINDGYNQQNICQRGYGLWSNIDDFPTNEEVYNFLKTIDQEKSGIYGILNCLKGIPNLKLPYSSGQLWGGTDVTGAYTNVYETITFDTCGYDQTINAYSTGPFLFTPGGFNNLRKLIWKTTNSVIRSQTIGSPLNFFRDSATKILQKLNEVYFGEGATILESYLFLTLLPDAYSSGWNNYKYIYTYHSNATVCPYDYPLLKTIYFPGSIKSTRDNALVVNNSDNFYLHPLYCGIGNTTYFPNLTQILLGPDWSLSIELTSLCFRDAENNPYYNLVLSPEAMIFNINNLKDCSNDITKQLIVTNKTIYDLRIYCNKYQGQEKVILQDTQCEMSQIIPSYENIIKIANNKNWEIITVAHSTWQSNLTDNADNLITDANTNAITT